MMTIEKLARDLWAARSRLSELKRRVIEDLLRGRGFELPLERAIFATVLHR